MKEMNQTNEIYKLCKNEDFKTNTKYPYIVKCINESNKEINKEIRVENEIEAFLIIQKRKIKELRKISYPFGWLPYVSNSSTINFQAKIFQDEQNTDYICFETKLNLFVAKMKVLESLEKDLNQQKCQQKRK